MLFVTNLKNWAKISVLYFVRFYLRCEILSFLLPLVHLRAAAPLQSEIKKALIF